MRVERPSRRHHVTSSLSAISWSSVEMKNDTSSSSRFGASCSFFDAERIRLEHARLVATTSPLKETKRARRWMSPSL